MPRTNVSEEFVRDCQSLGVEHALRRWRFSLDDLRASHAELAGAAKNATDALNVLYRQLEAEDQNE